MNTEKLPEDKLTDAETEKFGEQKKDALRVRNFIVNLFQKSPQTELTVDGILEASEDKFEKELVTLVHNFLQDNSYINVGEMDVEMEDAETMEVEEDNVATPKKSNVETIETEDVEKPETEDVQKSESDTLETTATDDVQKSEPDVLQTPKKVDVQKPDADDVQTPEVGQVKAAPADDVQVSETETVQEPETDDVQTPKKSVLKNDAEMSETQSVPEPEADDVETPKKGDVETAETDDVQMSETENAQEPKTDDAQQPEADTVQTPKKDGEEKAQTDDVEMSEAQKVEKPETDSTDTLKKDDMQTDQTDKAQAASQTDDDLEKSTPILVLGEDLSALACSRQLADLGHHVKLISSIDFSDSEACVWTTEDFQTGSDSFTMMCKEVGAEIRDWKLNLSQVMLFRGDKRFEMGDSQAPQVMEFLDEAILVYLGRSDGSKLEEMREELGFNEPDEPLIALSEDDQKSLTLGQLFEKALTAYKVEIDDELTNDLLWQFALLEWSRGGPLPSLHNSLFKDHPLQPFSYIKGNLLKSLAESLPPSVQRISGKVVENVEWKKDSVEVTLAEDEKHSGSALVVSYGANVLKNKSSIFTPAFPDWKASALERLGVSEFAQVELRFSEEFWNLNTAFGIVGTRIVSPTEIASLSNLADAERGSNFIFIDISKAKDGPTLLALSSGCAGQLENLESLALESLKKTFGDKYCEPEKSLLKKYPTTYLKPDSSMEDYKSLSKPIEDSVFFAGVGCRGPVARYSSGMRAASQVHGVREPPKKRKAPDSFEQPPAKKQATEESVMDVEKGSDLLEEEFDLAAEIAELEREAELGKRKAKEGKTDVLLEKKDENEDDAPVDKVNWKENMKKKKVKPVDVKNITIFSELTMESVRDAAYAKVLAVNANEMEDQKASLMSGLFAVPKKTAEKTKQKRNLRLNLTERIKAASPPRTEVLPPPSLPEVADLKFSDDEDDVELPKATVSFSSESRKKESKKVKKKEKKKEKKEDGAKGFKDTHSKIQKYVKKTMGSFKKSSKLKTDDRKSIVKKASKKIFEDYKTKIEKKGKDYKYDDFMTDKRKNAIKMLVKKYVKQFSK